jgi:hypothetical protein
MSGTYLCRDGLSNRQLVDFLQFSCRTFALNAPHYLGEQLGFTQVPDVVPTRPRDMRNIASWPVARAFSYRIGLRLGYRDWRGCACAFHKHRLALLNAMAPEAGRLFDVVADVPSAGQSSNAQQA